MTSLCCSIWNRLEQHSVRYFRHVDIFIPYEMPAVSIIAQGSSITSDRLTPVHHKISPKSRTAEITSLLSFQSAPSRENTSSSSCTPFICSSHPLFIPRAISSCKNVAYTIKKSCWRQVQASDCEYRVAASGERQLTSSLLCLKMDQNVAGFTAEFVTLLRRQRILEMSSLTSHF